MATGGTERDGPSRSPVNAWAIAILTFLLLLGGVTFLLPTLDDAGPEGFAFPGFEVVPTVAMTLLGIAVAIRQPGNVIGWLFLSTGFVFALQMLATRYARWAVVETGAPDGLANMAYWLEAWIWIPAFTMVGTYLFVLFPTRKIRSRRRRSVLLAAAAAGAVASAAVAFDPEFGGGESRVFTNPFGVPGASPVLQAVFVLALLALMATMVAGAGALVLRLRGSTGIERRQLQWVLGASVLAIVALALMVIAPNKVFEVVVAVSILGIPVSATIAILRYRLWDIDLLINRALVYLPLTALLAGLYTIAVAVLQRVFVAVTGETSEAATIVSALVLAAVFTPVRNGLQAAVDRRFKGDPDPARRLTSFAQEIGEGYHLVDPARLARRLAEQVRAATGAEGVLVEAIAGEHTVTAALGEPVGEVMIDVPLVVGGTRIGRIAVARRASGRPYVAADVDALRTAAEAVALAIRDAAPAFGGVGQRGDAADVETGRGGAAGAAVTS
jgi:hypothetical protein